MMGKPPISVAMEQWEGDFQRDLAYYLTRGFVWSSPDAFICMRPIMRSEGTSSCPTLDKADCWLVWWAVGDMVEMFRVAPVRLPYIAFYRKDRDGLRVYEFDKLRRKIYGKQC